MKLTNHVLRLREQKSGLRHVHGGKFIEAFDKLYNLKPIEVGEAVASKATSGIQNPVHSKGRRETEDRQPHSNFLSNNFNAADSIVELSGTFLNTTTPPLPDSSFLFEAAP